MKQALIALLAAGLSFSPVRAQEPHLPAELQLSLLVNVLSFDRKLAALEEVIIVVIYQSTVPASLREREDWLAAARAPLTMGNRPVRIIALEYRNTDELLSELQRLRAAVAVVSPLRSVDMPRLTERLRTVGVRTATGTPALARRAVAVGFVLHDGRPRIVINMPLALREGCDFSAQLLRMAEVIK